MGTNYLLVLELNRFYHYWKLACNLFNKNKLKSSLCEQYIDVCTVGDIIIHSVIDDMVNFDQLKTLELNHSIEYIQSCIDNLCETIVKWVENKEMTPVTIYAE